MSLRKAIMEGDLRVGDWLVQPTACLISKDGQTVHVRAKVMDLLVYLAARPGEVVSKDALLDGVWGTNAISESALTRTVTELRQALGDSVDDPRILVTIPKRGYRLVAPVVASVAEPIADAPFGTATAESSPTTNVILHRTLRPAVFLAGALVVVAIAVVWAVWSTGRVERVSPNDGIPVNPAHRVAVLPFTYRGADAHAYLAEGMVDLLTRTLDGAGPLRTVDPRAVLGVLAQQPRKQDRAASRSIDSSVATAVAKALGVGQYVSGDIVEAGGRLRITARLYRAGDAREPVSASVDGFPDDLFAIVDDLSKQLAVGGGAGPRLSNTAATTTSLQALKAFLEGEQFFRGSPAGNPQKSAYQAFERAVQLDSSFAIAWYRLSQTAYFSGIDLGKVVEFAETAASYSAHLPWRERRLIEANWAYARGAARESQRAYSEILRIYPNDVESLFGIALLGQEYGWLLGGPASKQHWVALLRYVPDHRLALGGLRIFEVRDRNCEAAHSLNHRMSGVGRGDRAVAVFCGPPSEEQEALLRTPTEWPENLRLARYRIAAISQNPRAAAVFARAIVERGESEPLTRQLDLLALAELELALGHRKAADEAFALLAQVNPHWALADTAYRMLAAHHVNSTEQLRTTLERLRKWQAESVPPVEGRDRALRHNGIHAHLRSYLLGRISASLGNYDDGRRFADDVEQMGSPKGAGSVARDLAQSVRAHVLNREGRFEEALRALEAAPREVPFHRKEQGGSWAFIQPQERFLRAELLARLGRHDDALWWYQSLPLDGPSHLRQAEILERLGRRQQAIEQYKRFLELWRDCDGEFRPLAEQAKSALKGLGAGDVGRK